MTGQRAYRTTSRTTSTSLSGPSEQLTPTAATPIEESVTAAMAGVVPRNVRPVSPKVMVAKNGKIRVLDGGEDGSLGLAQVGHGLDDDEVAARRIRGTHLLGEQIVGVVEGEGTEGSYQLPCRPDVACDVASPRIAGDAGSRRVNLLDARLARKLLRIERVVGGEAPPPPA